MPETYEALIIAALAVVPGYLATQGFEAALVRRERSDLRMVIEAIAGSMIFWLLAAPLVAWADQRGYLQHWPGLFLIVVLVLALPFPMGLLLGRQLRQRDLSQSWGVRPIRPRAWDHLFDRDEPFWVVVTLLDGSRISGLWGYKSYASTSVAGGDLYLEQVLQPSAEATPSVVPYSMGVWIPGTSIQLIECFHHPAEEDTPDAPQEEPASPAAAALARPDDHGAGRVPTTAAQDAGGDAAQAHPSPSDDLGPPSPHQAQRGVSR